MRASVGGWEPTWRNSHGAACRGNRICCQTPPVTAQSCDFYYGLDLPAGSVRLEPRVPGTRRGFGLAFDADVFRSVWVLGAYGGWAWPG
jgi:hypothetical protein